MTNYYSSYTANSQTYAENYRFGFNGMEKDNEVKGIGNSVNFGARIYDSRLGKWLSTDVLESRYPYASPYNFALNTPLWAFDPDGKVVVFVNGLMLDQAVKSNPSKAFEGYLPNGRPYPTFEQSKLGPTYLGKLFSYWGDIDTDFRKALKDNKGYYVNGSDHTWSSAEDRYKAGVASANEMVQKMRSGELQLEKGETIKLVGHSQGSAHAAGMAATLQKAYEDGVINNKVEAIYYLASHQPKDIKSPQGIYSVQYSRRSDKVSSVGIAKYKSISGGSEFGQIQNVSHFIEMPSLTGGGTGLLRGNRGGHDVGTYKTIFNLSCGGPGQSPCEPADYGSDVGTQDTTLPSDNTAAPILTFD